jgi:inner membrane protein
MDTITHVLTGGVIAKAIHDGKIGNWGTIAGLAVGFFPDSDFILGLFNRQSYLEYHRDFTHSLLLIPLYALFFSWLFVKISKRHHFWSYFKVCLPVLVSHAILDLLTSYGTMILSPFFDHRFSWDLVFIIDLVFSGIIFFPLVVSVFWKDKAQWVCRGSLIGLALYILFCWVQHHQAIELTKAFAKNLNEEVLQVASLPQPVSPYRWANYVETEDKVYQGFVNLTLKKPPRPPHRHAESLSNFSISLERLKSLYEPPGKVNYQSYQRLQDSLWVEKALTTEGVKFYYWFAKFPVVKSVNSKNGRHRVEFMDVRFLLPGIRTPFVYYVEFDDSGKIRSEGFVEDRKGR